MCLTVRVVAVQGLGKKQDEYYQRTQQRRQAQTRCLDGRGQLSEEGDFV